jgi:hypothetical protein
MVGRLLIGLLLAVALVGLYWFTVSQQAASCEACVVFQGRRACRSASATSEEEAQRHAIATACALVTRGVTEDLACQRTPPERLRCG